MTTIERKRVIIYTDGACIGNPGPGGYGVVLLHGTKRKELAKGFRLTTNNRMELMAAIVGLQTLKKPCAVTLHSDSRYVVDSIEKGWAINWRAKNWQRKGETVPNADLWHILLAQCEIHTVSFQWVKGHAGIRENERCDILSTTAARQPNLPGDEPYERLLGKQGNQGSLFAGKD
jgi:ribonuclease HI